VAEAPRRAIPVAVDETLKAGEDEQVRQRIARILATPEVKSAIADAMKVAVAAIFEGATTESSEGRVAELTRVVTDALAEDLEHHVVPAALAGAQRSIDAHALEGSVAAIVAVATNAALREAAKDIPTTLAPAARESLARELRSPDLRQALATIVGDATREFLVATRGAVTQVREANEETGSGLVVNGRRVLALSWLVAVGLGVLSLSLAAAALRMWRQNRRYKQALT
jgi:hypothetical protein